MSRSSTPAKTGTPAAAAKGSPASPKSKPKKRAKKADDATPIEETWPEMRRETRLLSDIHPYPNNPRTHPPAQVAFLANILKKYGPDQDIVIDGGDDMILKGHGRRLAAIAGGLREFPVTVRLGLSEAEKKSMRIEDNQAALMSGWDPALIRGEIAELKAMDYDVNLLGFGEAQLVQFTTAVGPPSGFQNFGDGVDTAYCCPKCKYSWSGDPLAGKVVNDGDENIVRVRVRKKSKSK